ncbi:MAG: FkbM family methyltransferase [Bryobacteraceae bacterium]|nr:FkbM family methyltransferase [Bryobacteraceae bacterium]
MISRVLKLGLLLIVVAAVAARFYPPVRHAALQLAGRSSICSFEDAVSAHSGYQRQVAIKDRILHASRRLEVDPEGRALWETPEGRYWVPSGSELQLPWLLAEQERRIYGDGSHAVQPGEIVLDCGANVGVFTKRALAAGAKLVIAIEPAPENLACFRRNLRDEIEAGRVIVEPLGVWDREDSLTLFVNPRNSATDTFVLQIPGAEVVQKVPLTTIDRLVVKHKLEAVHFIKMDIEGAEPRALAGARETMKRFRPRLSVTAHHTDFEPVEIQNMVRAARADYQMECGPCSEIKLFIRPDVLYFR